MQEASAEAALCQLILTGERVTRQIDADLKMMLFKGQGLRGPFSYQHFRVLDYVVKNPGLSRAAIAKGLGVPEKQVSHILGSLIPDREKYPQRIQMVDEAKELYVRIRGTLSVSTEGREVWVWAQGIVEGAFKRFGGALTQQHIECIKAGSTLVLDRTPVNSDRS